MKKVNWAKGGIALLTALLLLLTLAGCSDGDPKKKPGGKQPPGEDPGQEEPTNIAFPDNAFLTSLTIGAEEAELGMPAASPLDATPGSATVFQKTAPISCETVSEGAVASWAVVAAVDGLNEDELSDSETVNFSGGKILVVKSVSYDQSATLYYVINVEVIPFQLKSITVGDQTLAAATLPAPASTWERAMSMPRQIYLNDLYLNQPAGGYAVQALADENADVVGETSWAHFTEFLRGGSGFEITFNSDASVKCNDSVNMYEYLIVKVIDPSDDAVAAAYYCVVINIKRKADIYYEYNIPIIDASLAAVWENYNGYRLPIRKVLRGNTDASGEATLLWDDRGLNVYFNVTDPNITADSSVEIFVNEDYDGHTSGGYSIVGGQYRISASGEVSGYPPDAVNAFIAHNKIAAWEKTDGSGYIVTAQIPWRFKNTYPLPTGLGVTKNIGIELQINTQDAALVWNNPADSSYENVANCGEATMRPAPNGELKPDAEKPHFKQHPASGWYHVGAAGEVGFGSEVTAGDLSYQWYRAASWSDPGTPIGTEVDTQTNLIYDTLDLSALNLPVGNHYFYVKVTNNNPLAEGDIKTATVDSARARIQIFAAGAQVVEQLTLKNGYAIYPFQTDTWEYFNYSLISVDYQLDAGNLAKNKNSIRLMGEYVNDERLKPNFIPSGDRYMVAPWDDYNAPYVFHDWGDLAAALTGAGATATANQWFTLRYPLGQNGNENIFNPGPEFPENDWGGYIHHPSNLEIHEVFYFGLGIPGADAAITQLVRNVKLIHKDNVENDGVTLKTVGYDPTKDKLSTGFGLGGLVFTCDPNDLDGFDRVYVVGE